MKKKLLKPLALFFVMASIYALMVLTCAADNEYQIRQIAKKAATAQKPELLYEPAYEAYKSYEGPLKTTEGKPTLEEAKIVYVDGTRIEIGGLFRDIMNDYSYTFFKSSDGRVMAYAYKNFENLFGVELSTTGYNEDLYAGNVEIISVFQMSGRDVVWGGVRFDPQGDNTESLKRIGVELEKMDEEREDSPLAGGLKYDWPDGKELSVGFCEQGVNRIEIVNPENE